MLSDSSYASGLRSLTPYDDTPITPAETRAVDWSLNISDPLTPTVTTVIEYRDGRRVSTASRNFLEQWDHRESANLVAQVQPTANWTVNYYNQIDLALDSFPYNGTTTNCDSFMMGVPVLTRAGDDHRSRVTASQLSALGLNELITFSEEQYVDTAVALAHAPARLGQLADNLRERMLASPLMDAKGFTRELEQAYRQIWAAWCNPGSEVLPAEFPAPSL